MATISREKTILDKIVDARRESIAHRKRVLPEVALEDRGAESGAAARFRRCAFARNDMQHDRRAEEGLAFARHDARRLRSRGAGPELWKPPEPRRFPSSPKKNFSSARWPHLKEAKKVTQIPILRKDFIVDPWQVWEDARRRRRCFPADRRGSWMTQRFVSLLELGRSLKMEPLVEVHSREELDRAIAVRGAESLA